LLIPACFLFVYIGMSLHVAQKSRAPINISTLATPIEAPAVSLHTRGVTVLFGVTIAAISCTMKDIRCEIESGDHNATPAAFRPDSIQDSIG
jgi:hypothetical protein